MSRTPAETLRLLCRLRDAEVDGARGQLAVARAEALAREQAADAACETHETLTNLAETYVARHIREMAPTRDGASVYAALAFGAIQRRRDAASADIQRRRALSRREEAAENAEMAVDHYLGARARAEALGTRRDALDRADARRAALREDEDIAEARAALVAMGLTKDLGE